MATTLHSTYESRLGIGYTELWEFTAMYLAGDNRVIEYGICLGALDDSQTKELFDTHSTAIELLLAVIKGLYGSNMCI